MKMREDLFASILRQDIAFYDSHKSGEIMSRLTSDIQEFKSSFKQVCLMIIQWLRSFCANPAALPSNCYKKNFVFNTLGHIYGITGNGSNYWKYHVVIYDISRNDGIHDTIIACYHRCWNLPWVFSSLYV